jgi:hypothetical protein
LVMNTPVRPLGMPSAAFMPGFSRDCQLMPISQNPGARDTRGRRLKERRTAHHLSKVGVLDRNAPTRASACVMVCKMLCCCVGG